MAEGRKKRSDAGKTRPATTGRHAKDGEKPATKPRERLTAAQQTARDTLIVTRRAQGWTWEAVAIEAGCTESTARRAERAMEEHPIAVRQIDPVKEVERILLGYRLAVGDLQAIAVDALREGNHSAAVGAIRGSMEANERMLAAMQVTGLLPRDLGDMRHVLDARSVATGMLDALDALADKTEDVPMDDGAAQRIAEAVEETRDAFRSLIGIGEPLPDVEGTPSTR